MMARVELLNRIRTAPDLPIAVALDFHTQMTDAMIMGATIITAIDHHPGDDMADTQPTPAAAQADAHAGRREAEPRGWVIGPS